MSLDSFVGEGLSKSPYQEKCEEVERLRALLLHARDLLQHNDCLPCPGNCEGCTVEAAIDEAMK